MDIFDQILENLELERDLGTRTVEIDRALLVPPSAERKTSSLQDPVAAGEGAKASAVPEASGKTVAVSVSLPRRERPASPISVVSQNLKQDVVPVDNGVPAASDCDMAFFTGRPLSPAGMEAMEKVFAAVRRIKPGVTLCINEERKSRVCVLLGSDALLKRLPTARPVRGDWVTVNGVPAVMTFSPDYIFSHFREGSPNMDKAKREMWNDIRLAVARL